MPIYNQNKTNEFIPDCSVRGILQLIGLQYDIWLKYTTGDKLVDYFRKVGVLLNWGASFEKIYSSAEKKFEQETVLSITTKKVMINLKEFENMVEKGYYFGVGLLYLGKPFLDSVNRGRLDGLNIMLIAESKKGSGHHLVFGKGKNGTSLFDPRTGKEIECSIDMLRLGCDKGIFYYPARTLILDDTCIEKWLFALKNKDPIIYKDVSEFSIEEKQCIARASKLRTFKK